MKARTNIFFLSFLLFSSCGTSYRTSLDQLQCLRVTKIFPMPDEKNIGKISVIDTTSIDYYFYKDLRIYRMPYSYDTLIGSEFKFIETRYRYFLHEKDSLYGRVFDSCLKFYNKRAHIDTITNIRFFTDLQLSVLFNAMTMNLVTRGSNPDSGTLHEKYLFQNKTDSTEKGVLFLSYTNAMNDIPFHLSAYMDSLKKTKVNYYHITSFGGPVKQYNIVMDTISASVKMERIEGPHKEKVMEYINVYLRSK